MELAPVRQLLLVCADASSPRGIGIRQGQGVLTVLHDLIGWTVTLTSV